MKIAQISDVHFTHFTWNPLHYCIKRLSGIANWLLFRKGEYFYESLKSLPQLFQHLNVDLIMFAGDLTSTSLLSEFETAQNYFNQFSQPKLFIPGNHDQYTHSSARDKRFYHFFSNHRRTVQHPLDFFTLKEHGIEVHRLQPSIWCIALDTAPPTSLISSNGLFSITTEKYLEEALLSLPKNDVVLLLNHFPIFENKQSLHRLIRSERLRSILEKNPNIRLYLHGHTHHHSIADLRPNHLPILIDSGCPIQKPCCTWNLIDLSLNGCIVQGYHWVEQQWKIFNEADFKWELA